jgi:hypothetical protein
MVGQRSEEDLSGPDGWHAVRRRAVPVVARVLVIVLGLTGLLVAADGSVTAATSAWRLLSGASPTSDPLFEQFERLRRQLGEAVPPGSRIYVDQGIGVPWSQRIAEFAYLHDLTVTHDIRRADYTVTLQRDTAGALYVVATATGGR